MMFSETSPLILLPFRIVALHESGTRKAISWSVAVYNKTVSSQCNLIPQIEQVPDKYYHPTINIEKGVSSNRKDIGRQHGCSPLFFACIIWIRVVRVITLNVFMFLVPCDDVSYNYRFDLKRCSGRLYYQLFNR